MRFEITDQIRRHLAEDEIAWLTSVSPKGTAVTTQGLVRWDGTAIAIYSLDDGARPRHIAANDQVGMHFNASAHGTDVLVIGGRAEVVPDAPPASRHPGLLDRYATSVERLGQTPEWCDTNYGVALRVTPERAWTIPG